MKATSHKIKNTLMSGNEAIARGAYEAGVTVASGYPGTPSTEILENLSHYDNIYCEWSPNEKVALEAALGAAFAGARAMATMKHVGLNVAADPLFTSSYTGIRGGLIIITADDPEMHSSQNEQDNRNYAYAAKIPMLEPSDSAEALAFVRTALAVSEQFDTPVLLRTTTRVSHAKSLVMTGRRQKPGRKPDIRKMPEKFVMLPANARKRRAVIEQRMKLLGNFAETFPENRIEKGSGDAGFITSGISYQYVKEAFPGASVMKLGMVWPLPEKMIRRFARSVKKLYVIEELDPFIELHVRAMGIACKGKDIIPSQGEINPLILRQAVTGKKGKRLFDPVPVPLRPPNLCPGCPHRGIFHILSKLKLFVAGDIGCYTLAALKPLSALDTCVCMGASIGTAFGMEKAIGPDSTGKIVAVIGDSTFMHSGITGLIDTVYNRGNSTVIILDNRTTGMTGHQPHPATGMTLSGERGRQVDIEKLCRAIGINHVYRINPHDLKATEEVVRREVQRQEPSVIITSAPCVLLPEMKKRSHRELYEISSSNCTGCRMCLRIGCPAIEWVPLTEKERKAGGFSDKQKGFSRINSALCDGCGQCVTLCKFGAIVKADINK